MTKAIQWQERGLPFVLFKYPGEVHLNGIFQEDDKIDRLEDSGLDSFVFSPFNTSLGKIIITGEFHAEELSTNEQEIGNATYTVSEEGKEAHLELVEKAVLEIKRGVLQKVVLSRVVPHKTEKKPLDIFESLLLLYQNAFCYWLCHPKVGTWLGATPEDLMEYSSKKIHTTALAGTLPVVSNEDPRWTAKEKQEQQMVTDFISDSLKGKVDKLTISDTTSIRAGKLWHLKTDISGQVADFKVFRAVLKTVHPTPAVCGLPKGQAMEFIKKHEGYDREFYTGYLGTVNVQKEHARLFVNLRCLKYESGIANIYVGGGITAQSNPLLEWEETKNKSKTMLAAL